MKIQLLYFEGCPHVAATRAALLQALAAESFETSFDEIDVHGADAPGWARGWGSPTILVDGKDLAGVERAAASSCRLYAGGSPSVDAIRARITAARATAPGAAPIALPVFGAVIAALAASACCLVPAVLAMLGVSGVGFAASFAPYRRHFLIASALLLITGFWLAYRPRQDSCGCAQPPSRKAARVALWSATIFTVAIAAYPMFWSPGASAGAADAEAKATLHLTIIGMDCEGCTSTIANAIEGVTGVVSATVDFESGSAVVRYDGRPGMREAVVSAVEQSGYGAK